MYAEEISTPLITTLKTLFSFKISEMFRASFHASYVWLLVGFATKFPSFRASKKPLHAQGAFCYTVPQISFSKFPPLAHSLITQRVASSSSAGFPSSSK